LGVIVVDYFGLMRIERPSGNHTQDLAEISKGLKSLAKEIKTPIILLAQLNREVEKRQNKRPILSDLRDSGSLEQDPDIVLMLYRDHVYHDDADPRDAEILVRKQRNGPTGIVRLDYDAACTRFRNHLSRKEAV
jgi:replicative DNA helicase